jgi:hypothetical protein
MNWVGGMRVDVSHLRMVESAVTAELQLLAGQVLAGGQPVVVSGFTIAPGGIGQLAINLKLLVAGGSVIHATATEPGSLFQMPGYASAQQLNPSNANVSGSFIPGTNYIGIDLVRSADPTTADTVVLLSDTTGREFQQRMPLGRTLGLKIVVSSTSFSSQPTVLPIASVFVSAAMNVTSVTDCRPMAFRLALGGSSPSALQPFTQLATRVEPAVTSTTNLVDPFVGGDKGITSLRDWMGLVMTRLWESSSGAYWYSPGGQQDIKLSLDPSAKYTGTTNWFWDSATGNLYWGGVRYIFPSDGTGVVSNYVTNHLTALPGTTDLADGECLYVELDRRVTQGSLTPVKCQISALPRTGVPGAIRVFAWRVGSDVYVDGQTAPVSGSNSTSVANATTSSYGTVKLGTSDANISNVDALVPMTNLARQVLATGMTNGAGYTGALTIGDGANDTGVSISKSGATTTVAGSLSVTQDATARQFIVGGGGTIASGSVYSDSSWGMNFRAKQSGPTTGVFGFAKSDGTELVRFGSATGPPTQFATALGDAVAQFGGVHPVIIRANWAGLGFNTYFNGGTAGVNYTRVSADYTGHIAQDTASGDIVFATGLSGTAGSTYGGPTERVRILNAGGVQVLGGLDVSGLLRATPTGASGPVLSIGNDAVLYDIGVANHFGVQGAADTTKGGILLGSSGPRLSGQTDKLTILGVGDGLSTLTADAIGSVSISNGAGGMDDRTALTLMTGFDNMAVATPNRVSLTFRPNSAGPTQAQHEFGRITGGRAAADGARGYLAFHAGSVSSSSSDHVTIDNTGLLTAHNGLTVVGGLIGALTTDNVTVPTGKTLTIDGTLTGHASDDLRLAGGTLTGNLTIGAYVVGQVRNLTVNGSTTSVDGFIGNVTGQASENVPWNSGTSTITSAVTTNNVTVPSGNTLTIATGAVFSQPGDIGWTGLTSMGAHATVFGTCEYMVKGGIAYVTGAIKGTVLFADNDVITTCLPVPRATFVGVVVASDNTSGMAPCLLSGSNFTILKGALGNATYYLNFSYPV